MSNPEAQIQIFCTVLGISWSLRLRVCLGMTMNKPGYWWNLALIWTIKISFYLCFSRHKLGQVNAMKKPFSSWNNLIFRSLQTEFICSLTTFWRVPPRNFQLCKTGLLMVTRKKIVSRCLKRGTTLVAAGFGFGFFLIGYVIVTGGSRQHLCISLSQQLHLCKSVTGLRGPSFETRQMTHFAVAFYEHSRESVINCI